MLIEEALNGLKKTAYPASKTHGIDAIEGIGFFGWRGSLGLINAR